MSAIFLRVLLHAEEAELHTGGGVGDEGWLSAVICTGLLGGDTDSMSLAGLRERGVVEYEG